jgi:ectoine hydroxylase-related dioxygenase (phytanoyl-CoA dioxygenase family)
LLSCGQRFKRIAIASHADDLRWISGYVSVKSPRSPPLWWHQDWWCWDHPASFQRAASQVAVLSYVKPTSRLNGALRVLPGTHCQSGAIHAALPDLNGNAAENLPLDHAVFQDQPGQVTIELDAGDAVMVDYRLLHGTHANDTDFRRDCVILNFAPSWLALPDEMRGHLICHPALPRDDEVVSASCRATKVLPTFGGTRASLSLNRNAPKVFGRDI